MLVWVKAEARFQDARDAQDAQDAQDAIGMNELEK